MIKFSILQSSFNFCRSMFFFFFNQFPLLSTWQPLISYSLAPITMLVLLIHKKKSMLQYQLNFGGYISGADDKLCCKVSSVQNITFWVRGHLCGTPKSVEHHQNDDYSIMGCLPLLCPSNGQSASLSVN